MGETEDDNIGMATWGNNLPDDVTGEMFSFNTLSCNMKTDSFSICDSEYNFAQGSSFGEKLWLLDT